MSIKDTWLPFTTVIPKGWNIICCLTKGKMFFFSFGMATGYIPALGHSDRPYRYTLIVHLDSNLQLRHRSEVVRNFMESRVSD